MCNKENYPAIELLMFIFKLVIILLSVSHHSTLLSLHICMCEEIFIISASKFRPKNISFLSHSNLCNIVWYPLKKVVSVMNLVFDTIKLITYLQNKNKKLTLALKCILCE